MWIDAVIFFGLIAAVIAIGVVMSRHERDSESYFLAGRKLTWWFIGFSLIAANISTEQFVGMSGQAADSVGLAIASYEWMAAITLVVVAFFFLPAFLRSGIFTMPEFLEYRYNRAARTLMSLLMVITYVAVTIAAVIYSGAKTVDVAFSGQQVLGVPVNVTTVSWFIGVLAAVYVTAGGLRACAWTDLLWGPALILGGAVIMVLAFQALGQADPKAIGLAPEKAHLGPLARFFELNGDAPGRTGKLHMVLPMTDVFVPWTALVVGLWIPNFYYWGINQYIIQRTLAAKTVSEGQLGTVFAAGLKLLIPFVVVFPGIMAFDLFRSDMQEDAAQKTNAPTLAKFEQARGRPEQARVAFPFDKHFAELYPELADQLIRFNSAVAGAAPPAGAAPAEANEALLEAIQQKNASLPADQRIELQTTLIGYKFDSAFGLLIKKLVPTGLTGFIWAAIVGAVISSLASMLNAASTIFTLDLYREYAHRNASQLTLVRVGRASVIAFVAIGCMIAPLLDDPKFLGIFTYIQEFQGFISPGILGVFIFGLFVKRAPRACGAVGLLLSPIAYGLLKLGLPDVAFLNRMAITFFVVLVAMGLMTAARPLERPVELPVNPKMDLRPSARAKAAGWVVVLATIALYVIFW